MGLTLSGACSVFSFSYRKCRRSAARTVRFRASSGVVRGQTVTERSLPGGSDLIFSHIAHTYLQDLLKPKGRKYSLFRTCFLAACLLLYGHLSIAQSQPEGRGVEPVNPSEYQKSSAVVVGISQYDHIPSLKFAHRDAEAVAGYFSQHPEVGQENVTLLTDREATKENVERVIYSRLNHAQPLERVFFYFAGHGDANYANSTQGRNTGYLLCSGVETGIDYQLSQALPISTLMEYVNKAAQRGVEVILMIDACRAGEFTKNYTPITQATLTALAKQSENVVQLLACQPDQLAEEDVRYGGGHGAFTHFLLKAFEGDAFEGGKPLTLHQLSQYLSDKVSDATRNRQIPEVVGNKGKVFFRVKQAREKTAAGNRPQSFGQGMAAPSAIEKANKQEQLIQEVFHQTLKQGIPSVKASDLEAAINATRSLQSLPFQTPGTIADLKWKEQLLAAYQVLVNKDFYKYKHLLQQFEAEVINRETDAHLFHLIGVLYSKEGEFNKAIQYLQRSKQLAGRWSSPQAAIMEAYAEAGMFDQAFKASEEFSVKFPTRERNIELVKVSGLTNTGVSVKAGEEIKIKASGNLLIGRFAGNSGPEGRASGVGGFGLGFYNIEPDYSHAALMLRLNKSDKWQYVGKEWTFTAEQNGVIELQINDRKQSDNSGHYNVMIIRK